MDIAERASGVVHRRRENMRHAMGVAIDADLAAEARHARDAAIIRHRPIEQEGDGADSDNDERGDSDQRPFDETDDHGASLLPSMRSKDFPAPAAGLKLVCARLSIARLIPKE